jgi:hypothetical protein
VDDDDDEDEEDEEDEEREELLPLDGPDTPMCGTSLVLASVITSAGADKRRSDCGGACPAMAGMATVLAALLSLGIAGLAAGTVAADVLEPLSDPRRAGGCGIRKDPPACPMGPTLGAQPFPLGSFRMMTERESRSPVAASCTCTVKSYCNGIGVACSLKSMKSESNARWA